MLEQEPVIISYGEPTLKTLGFTEQQAQVTPCLYIKGRNFALGVLEENRLHKALWGESVAPVHGWRALRLLERLPYVDNTTLHACWQLSAVDPRETSGLYYSYLEKYTHFFGGQSQFETLRDGLLKQAPATDELEQIIQTARVNGAGIVNIYFDLKRELERGTVKETPFISDLIDEGKRKVRMDRKRAQKHFKAQKIELKRPISPEESLSVLFSQLEIHSFVIGLAFGFYGLDWSVTPVKDVDRNLKSCSFYDRTQHGEMLNMVTEIPTIEGEEISPGLVSSAVRIGEIKQPTWVDERNGSRYAFAKARYQDGLFFVTVRAESQSGQISEGEYPVSKLRQLLNLP